MVVVARYAGGCGSVVPSSKTYRSQRSTSSRRTRRPSCGPRGGRRGNRGSLPLVELVESRKIITNFLSFEFLQSEVRVRMPRPPHRPTMETTAETPQGDDNKGPAALNGASTAHTKFSLPFTLFVRVSRVRFAGKFGRPPHTAAAGAAGGHESRAPWPNGGVPPGPAQEEPAPATKRPADELEAGASESQADSQATKRARQEHVNGLGGLAAAAAAGSASSSSASSSSSGPSTADESAASASASAGASSDAGTHANVSISTSATDAKVEAQADDVIPVGWWACAHCSMANPPIDQKCNTCDQWRPVHRGA